MEKEIFNYLKANFKVYTVEECKQLEKDKGAYGIIYITQCKVNGKLYIGQKKIDRPDFDTYLGSGTLFLRAVDKYERDNFERIILEVAYSKEELNDFEIKYIELFDASEKYNRDLFYNIALGGDTIGLKGEEHPNYGKHPSEETRKKQSEAHKGKKLSEETIKKMSEFKKTEEHRRKLSEAGKGRKFSNEHKKNLSESHRGKNSSLYKGFVVIYPNGEVSKEMTWNETADYLGVCGDTIIRLAKDKTCYIGIYEHIRYIRILHLNDYLEERKLYKSNEDFKNMCKQMVEEAEKKFREAKGKYLGENNPNYGNGDKVRGKKNGRAKLVVAIFPDGRVIKDVCIKELSEELGISYYTINDILQSHEPYKAPNRKNCNHLKQFDDMIIMTQEDYLNTIENININDDKAS